MTNVQVNSLIEFNHHTARCVHIDDDRLYLVPADAGDDLTEVPVVTLRISTLEAIVKGGQAYIYS